MTERPILFNGAMVRAILDGNKTQTRRPVKPSPGAQSRWLTHKMIQAVPHGEVRGGGWQMHHPRAGTHFAGVHVAADSPLGWVRCPFGVVGDRLWVRETWCLASDDYGDSNWPPSDGRPDGVHDERCWYRATEPDVEGVDGRGPWRPSIHMPRWASRITLEVTDVRVQRVQDITEADARAEGTRIIKHSWAEGFGITWREVYGVDNWHANPWVWAISFKRVTP